MELYIRFKSGDCRRCCCGRGAEDAAAAADAVADAADAAVAADSGRELQATRHHKRRVFTLCQLVVSAVKVNNAFFRRPEGFVYKLVAQRFFL